LKIQTKVKIGHKFYEESALKYAVILMSLLLSNLALAHTVNPYGFIRCETHKMPLVTIDGLAEIKYDLKDQTNVNCQAMENYIRCDFGKATLFKDYRHSLIIDTHSAQVITNLSGRAQRLMMKASLNGKNFSCSQSLL
jgi:hypothetical protein